MNKNFYKEAWEDYLYWQRYDPKKVKRINELVKDIGRDAYAGIGKPEALRFDYSGWWSRRIDQEHRMVYRVTGDTLQILSLRYHYKQ